MKVEVSLDWQSEASATPTVWEAEPPSDQGWKQVTGGRCEEVWTRCQFAMIRRYLCVHNYMTLNLQPLTALRWLRSTTIVRISRGWSP